MKIKFRNCRLMTGTCLCLRLSASLTEKTTRDACSAILYEVCIDTKIGKIVDTENTMINNLAAQQTAADGSRVTYSLNDDGELG